MASYVLSLEALSDFQNIARYTRHQWGDLQAAKYRDQLESCAEMIATGKGNFKIRSDILPGLRMARCQSHYIFCLPQGGAPAVILAVLHQRMDLITRIAERLK